MISVIIPVYNNQEILFKKTLPSLAKQSYKDFEVIIVDDGSDPQIDLNYKDSLNIKFYEIPHGGAPKARNFGFEKSQGELVLFCDADLKLRPDCLARMKNVLDKNLDCSFVYSDFKYGWKSFQFWSFDLDKLKQNNYINTRSLLRRTDFPGFDESLEKFQDWDLWLTICLNGHQGVYLPEILFKAYTNQGAISHWLPKIIYQLPFIKAKEIDKYNKWKKIVQTKHNLI